MAKYAGKDAWLIVDGYDLQGYTTDFSEEAEALTEECHTLGDEWAEYASVELTRTSIQQNGFYDDDTLASSAALVEQQSSSRVLCAGVEGETVGKKFWGYAGALEATINRVVSRGALHKINARFVGSGQKDEGIIHFPLGALGAASGDGTAVDGTAQSAAGGVGYFHVNELTLGGYDDLTLKIQDSADDITYGDLVNATAVTTDPIAERVAVAGTVERYTRFNYAFTGAGAGQSATVFAGFCRL